MNGVNKPIRIVDYQVDRQRNPSESLEFLAEEVESGNISHMIVIYKGNKLGKCEVASDSRDYLNAEILWDVEQFKGHLLNL